MFRRLLVQVLQGLIGADRKALKGARVGETFNDDLVGYVIDDAADKLVHGRELYTVETFATVACLASRDSDVGRSTRVPERILVARN